MNLPSSLSHKQVRQLSKTLRHFKRALPKPGWCATNLPANLPAKEVCHDRNGYYYVGFRPPFGGLSRRARRRRR